MRIPAGHGPGVIPMAGRANLLHNLPVVVRECQANAATYGAKKAHAARIIFFDKAYFCYMHDGRPFLNLEDIKTLGLTPNASGGEGWSFQGNGLTYCAAYLSHDAQLVIASKTPAGFAAAAATPDWSRNEWEINEETPRWQEVLPAVLGERMFALYNVFYLFRIPNDSEPDLNYDEQDGTEGEDEE